MERRRDARFAYEAITAAHAILRPGQPVQVLNLSAGGALIETSRQLRPGSRVHLQLGMFERTTGITARVLRCAVASLTAAAVRYRGALRFESRCEELVAPIR